MISQLRHEASTTSRALNETLIENFESSFAVRMDNPFHTFDYLLRYGHNVTDFSF